MQRFAYIEQKTVSCMDIVSCTKGKPSRTWLAKTWKIICNCTRCCTIITSNFDRLLLFGKNYFYFCSKIKQSKHVFLKQTMQQFPQKLHFFRILQNTIVLLQADDELLSSSCVKRSSLRGNCDQSAMSFVSQGMEHALNGKHETHVLCQITEVKRARGIL